MKYLKLFLMKSSLHMFLLRYMPLQLEMSLPGTTEDILAPNPALSIQPPITCRVTTRKKLFVFLIFFWYRFLNLIFHSLEDPWSSSGYSGMLGNSPHIGQPGSFPAINPQDRMVRLWFTVPRVLSILWQCRKQQDNPTINGKNMITLIMNFPFYNCMKLILVFP